MVRSANARSPDPPPPPRSQDIRHNLYTQVPAPARRQAARGAAAVHDGADADAGVAAGVLPRGVRLAANFIRFSS